MVYLESTREPAFVAAGVLAVASDPAPSDALSCLENCLAALGADDRALILDYYGDGKAADGRRRLAEAKGISSVALRIRAHRLRDQLERCVRSCVGVGETFL